MLTANRIVHGLWIGPLTRLERLTLCSFVAKGHEFHLWRYERTPDPLPRGVVVRDANEILPHGKVFRKRVADAGAGAWRGQLRDVLRSLSYQACCTSSAASGSTWMSSASARSTSSSPTSSARTAWVRCMNVIKCPPRSQLMGELADEMSGRIGEDSRWFDFTRAFFEGIRRQNLQRFVRDDLMPPDHWDTVRPFVEGNAEFDPKWFGLHWINELWTTLRKTGGMYRGKRLTTRLPDKNHPIPGTRLFRLYQQFGLLRSSSPADSAPGGAGDLAGRCATRHTRLRRLRCISILFLPSMSLGGAERLVHDLVSRLQETPVTSKLFLLHDVQPSYPADGIRGCRVVSVEGQASPARMRSIAAEVLASSDARRCSRT